MMDLWTVMPAPAAVMFAGTGLFALLRGGAPRGRLTLFLAAVAATATLLCLGWLQFSRAEDSSAMAERLTGISIPLFCAFWVTFSFRFGRSGTAGFAEVLIPVAGFLASAAVFTWRLGEGGATWSEGGTGGPLLNLDTGADRAVTVLLLLCGALGIARFQALHEAARREGRLRLRRASVGPLMASLGLFLFASQALLYGGTSLHILSFASLGLVPACALLLPVLSGLAPSDALPESTRFTVSSLVLMGLGTFLVALAVLGQLIHGYLPGRELIWFHWGGSILLLVFASLWLVPGLREPLRRWFGAIPESSGDPRWEWARVNRALVPEETPVVLAAKLGSLAEDLLGRTGVALWLLEPAGDRMVPATPGSVALPALERENPLRRALASGGPILDLTAPPARLLELPPYVENQDLVERLGFRLFVALRVGGEELGVLGLAPRSRGLSPYMRGLLENLGGQLSNVVWGMTLAERLARTREGQSFQRLGSFVLHDLKNAVGVLKGTVFNMREHLDDPRFREDLLGTLQTTVDRMEGTLKRLRVGILGEPVLAPCRLAPMLEKIRRELLPEAERAGVRVDVPPCTELELQSDGERLETILHNLVRNAIEATSPGGVVRLEARPGRPERHRAAAKVLEVHVRDQGTAGDLARIQRSFLHPVHSEKPSGWGIGLYQSNLLADSLGGSLRAERRDDGGLAVILSLPVEPLAAAQVRVL